MQTLFDYPKEKLGARGGTKNKKPARRGDAITEEGRRDGEDRLVVMSRRCTCRVIV